jgi:hypothetical protein
MKSIDENQDQMPCFLEWVDGSFVRRFRHPQSSIVDESDRQWNDIGNALVGTVRAEIYHLQGFAKSEPQLPDLLNKMEKARAVLVTLHYQYPLDGTPACRLEHAESICIQWKEFLQLRSNAFKVLDENVIGIGDILPFTKRSDRSA